MNKLIKKKKINQNGFSLVEMLVSVAIFVFLLLIVTSIFQSVVKSQHNAIAAQSVQESMRFALEVMSKELRSAIVSNNSCDPGGVTGVFKVYNTYNDANGVNLYFKNRHGVCVYYFIDNTTKQFTIERFADSVLAITPDEVAISDFRVNIIDDLIGVSHSTQPKITFRMYAKIDGTVDEQAMDIQTTISSRYYE